MLLNRDLHENNVGRGPVFGLSNVSTNKCKRRKSRTMLVIIRSITLTKAKETITFPPCHSFIFIWPKTPDFKSSWPFNRGIKQNKIQKLNETYRKLKFDWDSTFDTIHRGITCPPLDPPCYLLPTMHMVNAFKTEFTQAQCYLM